MAPAKRRKAGSAGSARVGVEGGHLAYEAKGKGPPVLFVHSVIADSRMWDREFGLFASDRQTIRFDLRGFGGSSPATAPYSPLEDIRSLLDHLHVQRPLVVGSSMGGALAVALALESPERVGGLFLAAPGLTGGIEPPFDAKEQAALDYDDARSKEVAQAWSRGDAPAAFESLRQLWCSALQGSSLELFRKMVEENAPEVFGDRSLQHATSLPRAEGRLSEVRAPTTILVGDRDNPSSICFAQRIARSISGSRLVTVPGADHLVNLSQPTAFDTALKAALGGAG
jgi:3-oxoadipate enol-lactonase